MKIRVLVLCIIGCVCLCGCLSGTVGSSQSSLGKASSEVSQESNITQQQSADAKQETSASLNLLESGYEERELELISIYLPKKFVVKSNSIYEDDMELSRTVAEVISVENITNVSAPFAAYDSVYADAKSVLESTIGSYLTKSYHLQKEVSEGGITGFQNTIVYCIKAENKLIVINFYPAVGIGIRDQREEFEKSLSSIKLRDISL